MSFDVRCLDCGWCGAFSDLLDDAQQDTDGDLQGFVNACPECYSLDTEDLL